MILNKSQPLSNGQKKERHFSDFLRLGKILIFCLLIVVEIVLAANNRMTVAGIYALWVIVPTEVALTVENAVKIWGIKKFKNKVVCYVLDTLFLLLLTLFSSGTLISTLYVIILTEFYTTREKLSDSIAMGVCSVVLFLATFGASYLMKNNLAINVSELISSAVNDLLILVLHFLVVNFALQIYRKNAEITKTVEELNETNNRLREANAELQQVTVLEERQRIAKEIHDTAGHSITTVIMQTEAAKLVIDSDPQDAKRKISAANLQAKHALEELRESVHLLSGQDADATLKDALLQIVHESTDGTNIVIRSDIDEIELCEAKRRFLRNALKEGISNGLRHGGATAFWFECKQKDGRVEFLLSDNGAGQTSASFKEGFGLSGMRKHAESLGGTVRFVSEPGEGFEIRLSLPDDDKRGK